MSKQSFKNPDNVIEKYQVFGNSTLIKSKQLNDFLHTLPSNKIKFKWIITTEKRGTPKEHIHWFITSSRKACNNSLLRDTFKKEFKIEEPKNGELNFVRKVENPYNSIVYLTKEGYPEFVQGFPIQYMKTASRLSYNPKISMSTAIIKLKEELITQTLTPEEYVIAYVKLRKSYKKPDIYWNKQYYVALELTRSNDDIVKEVKKFIAKTDKIRMMDIDYEI